VRAAAGHDLRRRPLPDYFGHAAHRSPPRTGNGRMRPQGCCHGSHARPNLGPHPTVRPFCNLSLVLAVAMSSLRLPSQRGPGTLKKKQPEVRHPLYLCAQTPPHEPGPSGQVLLHSFNQVLQNASEPAANTGPTERPAIAAIIIATNNRVPLRRIVFSTGLSAFARQKALTRPSTLAAMPLPLPSPLPR